jgi:CMP-N-acetylneuraminic acid synthetase
MKSIDDIAVIIQARLGSQRVPAKMLRDFAGSTLLDIALEKLKRSTVFPKECIYLCVHEPELAASGRRHGVNVFRRSARSASSEGNPLMELYEWWDRLPHRYGVLINACLPFLSTHTIDAFVRQYAATKADGLFGVIERRNYFWDENHRLLCDLPGDQAVMNTKSVGVTYEAAHALYAGRLDRIGKGVWMGDLRQPGEIELFPVAEEEALDIDYPWQFEMAESLYNRRYGGSQHELVR